MGKEIKPILVIGAVVTVVVLMMLALRSATVETHVDPPVELAEPSYADPTSGPSAIIFGEREEPKTSFFGLFSRGTRHVVSVQFYTPAGCLERIAQGEPWPGPDDTCNSEVPVTGLVTGLGTTQTGETIVIVDTEITEECAESVDIGDDWPRDSPGCP